MNTISLVKSWKNYFGLPINNPDIFVPEDQQELAWNLIKEELKELITGLHSEDKTMILDGLGDTVWVCHNALLLMGHYSDIQREEEAFYLFCKNLNTFENKKVNIEFSKKSFISLLRSLEEREFTLEVFSTILLKNCYVFSSRYGILLGALLDEIFASNYSKLVREEDIIDTATKYENQGIDVKFSEVKVNGEKLFVVRNSETNKVLKSIKFIEPNLSLDNMWPKHTEVLWR